MIFQDNSDPSRKKARLSESDQADPNDEQSDIDSDIWANSDDDENGQISYNPDIPSDEFYGVRTDRPENNEIASIRRIHAKQGYLAGLSSAKEDSLQLGFDHGYPIGADLGIRVGQILSSLHIISALDRGEISKTAEAHLKEAQVELHIKKILNRRYFDDDLKLYNGEEHPLIVGWNNKISGLLGQINTQ